MTYSKTISKCLKILNNYTKLQCKKRLYYKEHPALYNEYLERLRKKHIHYLQLKIKHQKYHWNHSTKNFRRDFKNRYTYNQSLNHLTYEIKALKAGGVKRVRAIGQDGSISTISLLPQSFDTENHLQHSIHNHMQNATLSTKGIIAFRLHFKLSLNKIKNINDILKYNKFNHKYESKIELLKYYCNFNLNIKNKKIHTYILTIPIFANQVKFANKINGSIHKFLKQKTMFDFLQWYFIDDKYYGLSILPKNHP